MALPQAKFKDLKGPLWVFSDTHPIVIKELGGLTSLAAVYERNEATCYGLAKELCSCCAALTPPPRRCVYVVSIDPSNDPVTVAAASAKLAAHRTPEANRSNDLQIDKSSVVVHTPCARCAVSGLGIADCSALVPSHTMSTNVHSAMTKNIGILTQIVMDMNRAQHEGSDHTYEERQDVLRAGQALLELNDMMATVVVSDRAVKTEGAAQSDPFAALEKYAKGG